MTSRYKSKLAQVGGNYGNNEAKVETLCDASKDSPLILTGAVSSEVLLKQAYTFNSSQPVPSMTIALSSEKIFDVLFGLLDLLGERLEVILDVSALIFRWDKRSCCGDFDSCVVKSRLLEYEDVVLNDGFLGLNFQDESEDREISLDEHKLLHVFGNSLHSFKSVVERHEVGLDFDLRTIMHNRHVHYSNIRLRDARLDLMRQFGLNFF